VRDSREDKGRREKRFRGKEKEVAVFGMSALKFTFVGSVGILGLEETFFRKKWMENTWYYSWPLGWNFHG
jgi:hypothetical protein